MDATEVLICGAGPSGLVLALWLTKFGVRVRIVDKTAEAGTTSRAVAVAARTLELYEQLGLAEAVLARGHAVSNVNLWVRGKAMAHVPVGDIGAGMSRYSALQMFPQDAHERLLIDRLEAAGVRVGRRTELTGIEGNGKGVVARLRKTSGEEERCEVRFLAGCDGAHSIVRKHIGAGFEGGTYRQLFYVADIEASGEAADGGMHLGLDEADFLAVFPLSDTGRARLIGTVRDERADRAERLGFDDVSGTALSHLDLRVHKVNWFSTYHVHHRVSDRFRHGSAFLVGDAAHVHSPAGGQGMNTGIGDAINLAWKLAAVIRGQAPDALLDSYADERMRFARRLVRTTDRIFTFVTAEGAVADLVRTRLAPQVVPRVLAMDGTRRLAFRTISQLALNYRQGPLATGHAGNLRGGDRLPWVRLGEADNFATLTAMRWQVHVYGAVSPGLRQACDERSLPLHAFDWQPAFAEAGLTRDALHLLRPDGYLAAIDPQARPETLAAFFGERGLNP